MLSETPVAWDELADMKVPASVRRIHEDQQIFHSRLKKLVDESVAGLKQPRWHYESRIKELDSFALKLESGRFASPTELEDFFACTLVVANGAEIASAEKQIVSTFQVRERRPANDAHTHKSSECFSVRRSQTLRNDTGSTQRTSD